MLRLHLWQWIGSVPEILFHAFWLYTVRCGAPQVPDDCTCCSKGRALLQYRPTETIHRARSSENLSSEFRARRVTNRVSYHVSSNTFACSSRLDNVLSKRDTLSAMCRVKIKTIHSPLDLIMEEFLLKKKSIKEQHTYSI